MATFTKLKNGDWGVRGAVGELRAGRHVTVTRKDKSTSDVLVTKVLWQGDDIAIAAIQSTPKQSNSNTKNGGPKKRCWECGGLFTYRDCRENEGDWHDSYCGC